MIFKTNPKNIGKFCLITLIILLTISNINAIDNSTTNENNTIKTVQDDYQDNLNYNQNETLSKTYNLNSGSFKDIQNTINKAKTGDTINLSGYFEAKDNKSIINITKKVTITSTSGAVLDGKNISGILYLKTKSNGSTISGLNLINGYRTLGSAVFINTANITIKSCTFENNTAYSYGGGGAVCTSYDLNKSANLLVEKCLFKGNKAPVSSGALAAYGYNSNIIDCYFERNYAYKYMNYTTYEGALQVGINNKTSKNKIHNCTFKNNYAEFDEKISSQGGATAIHDGTSISNCIFLNNTAKHGGALIYKGSGTIRDTVFINNSAKSNGGAITTEFSKINNINISTSIFQTNTGKNGTIFSFGSFLTIDNCHFNRNIVDTGVIYSNTENSLITNSYFISNIAKDYGILFLNTTKSEINHNNFLSNNGGGIYSISNQSHINYCNFTKNNAQNGGAITAINCEISNSNFHNNTATEFGGAIISKNNLKIRDSYFTNNTSKLGGAIYGNNCLINTCIFFNNYANNGGGIYSENIILTNSNFLINNAKIGGSLYLTGKESIINKSTFVHNTAENGGAIFTSSNSTEILNTNLTRNIAINGGCIYSKSNLTIQKSEINNNLAELGGGIYNDNYSLNINDSIFNNNSGTYGGSLFLYSNSHINRVEFTKNTAINGSAIYNNGILNITNSTLTDNLANSFKITGENVSVKKGEDITIKVKLEVGDNVLNSIYNNGTITINNKKPLESTLAINQEIFLELNNETYSEYTNETGIATFKINSDELTEGNYTYYIYHPETELYTEIESNGTIEILPSPPQTKKKTLLTSKEEPIKKSKNYSKTKPKSSNNKSTGAKNKNNKIASHITNIGKQTQKQVYNKIKDIKKFTKGNPLKILDYPVFTIPGYKEYMKKHPIAAEVIDVAIGIDKNGQMSVLDFALTVATVIPVGGISLRGLRSSAKIGKKLNKTSKAKNILPKIKLSKHQKQYINKKNILKLTSTALDFTSKPIGTITTIISKTGLKRLSRKIIPQVKKTKIGKLLSSSKNYKNIKAKFKKNNNKEIRSFGSILSPSTQKESYINIKSTNKYFKKGKNSKKNKKPILFKDLIKKPQIKQKIKKSMQIIYKSTHNTKKNTSHKNKKATKKTTVRKHHNNKLHNYRRNKKTNNSRKNNKNRKKSKTVNKIKNYAIKKVKPILKFAKGIFKWR